MLDEWGRYFLLIITYNIDFINFYTFYQYIIYNTDEKNFP